MQSHQRKQRILSALVPPPQRAGPERVLRRFSPDLDVPVAGAISHTGNTSGVTEIERGWRLSTNQPRVFTLFRVPGGELAGGMLTFRAEIRSHDADTNGYLELWCRVPGDGQYFAKDSRNATKGERRWRRYEVPFLVPSGKRLDEITLNLTCDGPGVVEIRNVEFVWSVIMNPLSPGQLPRTAFRATFQTIRFSCLTILNATFVTTQLVITVVATVLGFEVPTDRLITWWPKNTGPVVGKRAG